MHQIIQEGAQVIELPQPGQKTVTLSGKALKFCEEKYAEARKERPYLRFAEFIAERVWLSYKK